MSLRPFSIGKSCWGVSALLLSLGVCACAGLGITPTRSSGYSDAVARYTQTDKLYVGLETQLDIQAVYRGAGFRRLYMDEYARVYNLSAAEKDKYLAIELDQAQKFEDFILVVNSTLSETNDLQKADSTWRVYLFRNGTQIGATSIQRLRWKEEFLNRFYPLANPWSRVYLVRFTIPAGTPAASSVSVSLAIAGPPGKVTLGWKENFPAPVPNPDPESAPGPATAPILNEKAG
ncbi:MAG: hypothetical protein PHE84_15645 [bacterium]|nr:hypothetical protein [bacterium]